MKPGRELDALVAEKVMGWRPGPDTWEEGPTFSLVLHSYGWSPSTDIAAAAKNAREALAPDNNQLAETKPAECINQCNEAPAGQREKG